MARARVAALVLLMSVIALAAACSSADEHIGSSRSAVITPNSLNYQITSSSLPNRHELSTTFLNGPWGAPAPSAGHGRWITVWNTGTLFGSFGPCSFGYAYSPDGRGQNIWQPSECTGYLQWNDPGVSPHNNLPFGGYLGDIAVAPLLGQDALGQDLSNGGKRSILVQIAKNDPNSNVIADDVVALLGDFDANDTLFWRNPAYVDTGPFSMPPSMIDSGGRADIPHVATNPVTPFHTFATWEATNLPIKTWLRQVGYEANGNFCNGSGVCGTAAATPIQIPTAPDMHDRRRPSISIGKLADTNGNPLPCTSGGEAVFVVSVDSENPRCTGSNYTNSFNTWRMQIYDVAWNVWYGPWVLYAEPASGGLPNCVGSQGQTDNSNDLHIATDTTTDWFWVTHTVGQACGATGCPNVASPRTSAVHVEYGWLNCPSPPPPGCVEGKPCPQIQQWSPPVGSGTSASWVPAIASTHLTPAGGMCPNPSMSPPCQRTALYWYATYDDPSGANTMAQVYTSYIENYGLIFSAPQPISFATPMTMEAIPWDNTTATYWDYQHLGANYAFGTFLAAWNDHRLTYASFWSDLLQ